MGLFDILTNGSLGSVLDSLGKQGGGLGSVLDSLGGSQGGGIGSVLDSFGDKARSVATNIRDNTPGGLGGLAGAGALGALFGNVLHGDIMKSVALAGAGAVAWNFYKKWAASQQGGQQAQAPGYQPQHASMPAGWGDSPAEAAPPATIDPTAELVMRAMIYAARSDGNIDADEQERIDQILTNMLPGQDVRGPMQRIRAEVIDPNKIAVACGSPEQAEDVYRLSCAVIDIDHFMEHSYTDALAKALGISPDRKKKIEKEADQARRQLMASVQAA